MRAVSHCRRDEPVLGRRTRFLRLGPAASVCMRAGCRSCCKSCGASPEGVPTVSAAPPASASPLVVVTTCLDEPSLCSLVGFSQPVPRRVAASVAALRIVADWLGCRCHGRLTPAFPAACRACAGTWTSDGHFALEVQKPVHVQFWCPFKEMEVQIGFKSESGNLLPITGNPYEYMGFWMHHARERVSVLPLPKNRRWPYLLHRAEYTPESWALRCRPYSFNPCQNVGCEAEFLTAWGAQSHAVTSCRHKPRFRCPNFGCEEEFCSATEAACHASDTCIAACHGRFQYVSPEVLSTSPLFERAMAMRSTFLEHG
ncbi:unnamed protein product [Polarella glacialis]|uniref:Uncharacterized protein n=1 Tax=Polarella glacialis TaxID=89957 RepID=A0A813EJX0_POLGL|nr:unnamed protein product [Polarella glacialis]